ncbi:MAG: hypothetical protein NVS3B20_22880 [Polyangiales bacterium]
MPNEALPNIDFTTLVLSLSQTVLVHLGEAPHPDHEGQDGGETSTASPRNLPLARQTIDLLGILQDKTKGNLTGGEERLLDQVLYDLRLRFVEVSKADAASKGE